MKCLRTKPDRVRCSRNVKSGSELCWQHIKKCASKLPVKAKAKKVAVKKKTIAKDGPSLKAMTGDEWIWVMYTHEKKFLSMTRREIKINPKWEDDRVQGANIYDGSAKYYVKRPAGITAAVFIASFFGDPANILEFDRDRKLPAWLRGDGSSNKLISFADVVKHVMSSIIVHDVKTGYTITFAADDQMPPLKKYIWKQNTNRIYNNIKSDQSLNNMFS